MKAERCPAVVRCIWMDESARAVRIIQEQTRGGRVDVWIPRSQIELQAFEGRDSDGNKLILLEVPEWLAEKEGLEFH